MQAEVGIISNVSADGRVLTLESPLQYDHISLSKNYGSGPMLEIHSAVASLGSNIVVEAADGKTTYGDGGEAFGFRTIVHGPSYTILDNVAFR